MQKFPLSFDFIETIIMDNKFLFFIKIELMLLINKVLLIYKILRFSSNNFIY